MSLAKRSLRHLVKLLSAVLLGALIGVNGVAFMQVWAMTHFVESGERTARPEQLDMLDKLTVILSGVIIPRPQNQRTPADLSLAYETHHFASPNATPLEAWYIPGNDAAAADGAFSRLRCEQSLVIVGGASFPRVGFGHVVGGFLRFRGIFGYRNNYRHEGGG